MPKPKMPAAPQPLVQPADRRPRGIIDREDRAIGVARESCGDIERAVAQRPGEHGLYVEALVLPLLVVSGDPLGRQRLDVVDPQNIADRVRAGHARAASVTALRLVLVVSGAAGIANEERRRRKLPAILGSDTGWKFCAIHAKGAALVIDQAPRPELSNRKKPCALEKCGSPARSATD